MAYAASILVLALLALAAAYLAGQAPFSVAILAPAIVGAVALVWMAGQALQPRRHWIVVDGSNVLRWRDGPPDLATVALVVRELERLRYTPVVWFGAEAGFLVAERRLGPGALARALRLPTIQVLVAPDGTRVEAFVFTGAREMQAPVVTNASCREWVEHFPEIAGEGRLVRGSFTGKKVTLLLAPPRLDDEDDDGSA